MSKLIKFEDKRFNSMVRAMRKNTTADLEGVVRALTGAIVEQAARNTGKSNKKRIRKDVDDFMSKVFKASNGDKVRKAKDGSVVFKSPRMGNRWIRVRSEYNLKAISNKNPAGKEFSKNTRVAINRALSQLRTAAKKLYDRRASQVSAGQASFLHLLKILRIPIRGKRGLGAALKVDLPASHKSAVSAKGVQTGFNKYVIFLKSKSRAALNRTADGRRSFFSAFYGQAKSFRVKTERQIEKTAKRFASKNGFYLK